MALTNAERQRAWRERHRGEPQSNKALTAKLAALQARVVQLEAELATRPPPGPVTPARRLKSKFAALKQECDELAERLAQIEAYQPGITEAAKGWVAQIDGSSRAANDGSEWDGRN
jgi:BMFP domain-containing protein YqiC